MAKLAGRSLLSFATYAVLATVIAVQLIRFRPLNELIGLKDDEEQHRFLVAKPEHRTSAQTCPVKDIAADVNKKNFKSQSGEDKLLLTWFNGLCNGTYIEMGALNGIQYSNSYFFHKELGWKGVLVELTPKDFESLKRNRPNDVTVHAAVCDKRQTVHYVTGARVGGAIDGIWEFMAPSFREKWWKGVTLDSDQVTAIECIPMKEVLEQSGYQYFDFYSLDVEGAEYEVLQSVDFDRFGFGIMMVEADKHNPIKNLALRMFIQSKGYTFLMERGRSYWFVNDNFAEIYHERLHP